MSRGLPEGASTFFGDGMLTGIGIWIAGGLFFTALYSLLWHRDAKRKSLGFFIAMILLSLPPFGVAGWGSPMTAAGLLFPAKGFIGLGLMIVIIVALSYQNRVRTLAIWAAVTFSIVGGSSEERLSPPNFQSTVTHQEYASISTRDSAYQFFSEAGKIARNTDAEYIVFSEGAAGWLTNSTKSRWTTLAEIRNKTFIIGFEERTDLGANNSIAVVTEDGFKQVYNQRMPVPISMWRPWSKDGTRAHWFDTPSVNINDQDVALLICYEQLLVWPIIQSAAHDPDIVIGIANDWWAAETSIPAIQLAKMQAWARLFEMDIVTGFNL